MAHYRASVDIQQTREEVFAYLSDFSNTREWDASVTLDSTATGTRLTYDADLALKGPLRIADPVLALAFNRVGDRALAGLRRALAPSPPQALSPLSGRALDGTEYELPGDLGKQHTFLVVAFHREQQRWFIDGGMTRGIPDAAVRARTITVYTDVGKVARNLGLTGTDTIALLMVWRSGGLLARETGGFEERKAERLAAALGPKPSSGAGAA
jgi:hypothetical protein